MKRLLLLFAAILMANTGLKAQTFVSNFITYEITSGESKKEVKVYGYDNSFTNPTEVLLPPTVDYNGYTYTTTAIGAGAFSKCSSLKHIFIPHVVTKIDMRAFSGCKLLSSVAFAEDSELQTIGQEAFNECYSLRFIVIPNNVTLIEKGAFMNCENLKYINFLGSTPPSLGVNVFGGCNALSLIIVPEGTEDAYKTAWCSVADKIFSAERYIQATLSDLSASGSTAIETIDAFALSEDIKDGFKSRINNIVLQATTAIIEATEVMKIMSIKENGIENINSIVSEMEQMYAKTEAIAAINAKIAGIDDSEILSIANDAKARIETATSTTDIETIKNEYLDYLAIVVKYYILGKTAGFGTLSEKQNGPALIVTDKDDKEIILYSPKSVEYIKVNEE